ncbi:MAG: polysulfide reductase NrfD [Myxococcales bacterium]
MADGNEKTAEGGLSRRNLLKVAGAGAVATAFVRALAPMREFGSGVELEAFLQKHYKELSADDKKAVFARLEARALREYGAKVTIRDPQPAPEVEFGYALNLSVCVGCRQCAEACHRENNHDRATHGSYIRVLEMPRDSLDLAKATADYDHPVPAPGKRYMPVQCHQCRKPACVSVCPVKATWKEKDGPVVIDYEWCIGCRYCEAACPYHARRFNFAKARVPAGEVNPDQGYLSNRLRPQGVMEKCTFCLHRTREGRLPACLEACPAGARVFGNLLESAVGDPLGAGESAHLRPQGGRGDRAELLLLPVRVNAMDLPAAAGPHPLPPPAAAPRPERHWSSYPRFLLRLLALSTDGSPLFYVWMTALTAMALVGANAWAQQMAQGMTVTGMTDHVSWGLYIANFTFMVGVAAGGVMMVIPAYVYGDRKMHAVVIVGEMLAVAAIVMAMLFVLVDLGRPDRFWHLVPGLGQFNWPFSMLAWDVLVLNGYLLLNLHVCGYLLYTHFLGRRPNPRWYVPFVFLSIAWAISIHTVTAFLYSGLGGRPLWNSALLAPRFLASAFVSGPAFLVVAMHVAKRFAGLELTGRPVNVLVGILKVTVLLNLFMVLSEVFTEFYGGGAHTASAHYLFMGLHGHHGLVPWIWTAVGLNVLSAGLLYLPNVRERPAVMVTACSLTFVGVWIEKGMGLVVPGFIPSTLHEIVEYQPSLTEWRVTAGIWAFGLLLYTLAIKIAAPILSKGHEHEA